MLGLNSQMSLVSNLFYSQNLIELSRFDNGPFLIVALKLCEVLYVVLILVQQTPVLL